MPSLGLNRMASLGGLFRYGIIMRTHDFMRQVIVRLIFGLAIFHCSATMPSSLQLAHTTMNYYIKRFKLCSNCGIPLIFHEMHTISSMCHPHFKSLWST